jgi:hypothetical protein
MRLRTRAWTTTFHPAQTPGETRVTLGVRPPEPWLLATGPVSSVAARLVTGALKRTRKGSEDEWTGLAVQPYTVLSPEIL